MKLPKEMALDIYHNKLNNFQKQYAFKNGGFNALHDLMNSNALLPPNVTKEYLMECINELDKLLLVY